MLAVCRHPNRRREDGQRWEAMGGRWKPRGFVSRLSSRRGRLRRRCTAYIGRVPSCRPGRCIGNVVLYPFINSSQSVGTSTYYTCYMVEPSSHVGPELTYYLSRHHLLPRYLPTYLGMYYEWDVGYVDTKGSSIPHVYPYVYQVLYS